MKNIDDLMYHAGLTAQGCWDNMDQYDQEAIEKFAELIVRECVDELRREWYKLNADAIDDASADPRATGIHIGQKTGTIRCISRIKEHFGVD